VLKDASGATIVGAGPFKNAIAMTSSDTANGALSKTVLRAPSDEGGITANYNGANTAGITYSASGAGLAPGDVTNAILVPAKIGAAKIC
jgi:hypothetical protein